MTTKELYKAARAFLGGRVGLETSGGVSVDPLDPKLRDLPDWGRCRVVVRSGIGRDTEDRQAAVEKRTAWLAKALEGSGLDCILCDDGHGLKGTLFEREKS